MVVDVKMREAYNGRRRAWVSEIETGGNKHMFRMLEKSRTPDKCKLRCRIASLILVSLMISLLWGCVSNGTENSTESVTKHSAEREVCSTAFPRIKRNTISIVRKKPHILPSATLHDKTSPGVFLCNQFGRTPKNFQRLTR